LIIVFAVLFGIMSLLNPQRFLTLINMQSMASQISDLSVMSLAMFVVIMTGNINLSVVSSSNLSAIICAMVANGTLMSGAIPEGAPRILATIAMALFIGLLCGVLNGIFIAGLRLDSILVTVATMSFYEGISILLTGGKTVMGIPEQLLRFGTGSVLNIPNIIWLAVLCYIMVALFFNVTTLGEQTKLSGANRTANLYSGGNNFKTVFSSFAISGLLCGVSGIIVYTKTGVAVVDYGVSFINIILLVVLLGGASMNGGFGKVSNIFIAALSVQIISSGMNIGGFSVFFNQVLWGVLLIFVVVINTEVAAKGMKQLINKIKATRQNARNS